MMVVIIILLMCIVVYMYGIDSGKMVNIRVSETVDALKLVLNSVGPLKEFIFYYS